MPQRNLGPSRRLPAALHNAASKFGGDPEQRKADRQPTLGSSPASLWDEVVAEKMALVLVKALEAVETNAGGDARLQRRFGLRALPPPVIPMPSHEHCVVS